MFSAKISWNVMADTENGTKIKFFEKKVQNSFSERFKAGESMDMHES